MKPQLPRNIEYDKVVFPVAGMKKIDGERLLLTNDFLSRSMKPIKNQWVVDQLLSLNLTLQLDGEIQVGGCFAETAGFLNTKHKEGDFVYHVFDIPIENMAFYERHKLLSDYVEAVNDPRLQIVPITIINDREELDAFVLENGADASLDGTVIRRMLTTYKYGRSTLNGEAWKIKPFEDTEAVIIGTTERMKNNNPAKVNELGRSARSGHKENLEPTGMIGTYICEIEFEGEMIEFQVACTGTLASRTARWHNRAALVGRMVKYKFMGIGSKGRPRHPTELGLRDLSDMS